jgi:hypothetical protein
MLKPVVAVGGCAELIVIGPLLATVNSSLGSVKRALGPSSLRREYRDEQAEKRR